MSRCFHDLRDEVELWNHHYTRALTYLESIIDNTDEEDPRLVPLVNRFEKLEREAKIQTTVLEELVSASDLKQEDIENLFEMRIKEVTAENANAECSKKLEALKEKLQPQEEEQEDLVVESVRYSRKDHISKKDIEEPVRNMICKHVYDKETVEEFIKDCKRRRMLCQCPVPSCRNKRNLAMKDMEPYPDFFNFLID